MKDTRKIAFGYQDSQAARNGYRQILIRFPERTFDKLAYEARCRGISFASLVREYVQASMKR